MTTAKEVDDLVLIHKALRQIARCRPGCAYGSRKGFVVGAKLHPVSIAFRKIGREVHAEFWPNAGHYDGTFLTLSGEMAKEAWNLIERG